jgi:hypothetical protein
MKDQTSIDAFLQMSFYTGYFTCDNEHDEIKNATHNTFGTESWILPRPHPDLRCKCIVGCIFNSVVRIITREIPSIYLHLKNSYTFPCLSIS